MTTTTTSAVTRLSRGTRPSMHRYYDIPCESRDGRRIVYFEFDGPIPGPGAVVVAARDGSDAREIGRCEGACVGHVGAHATWLGDDTVWFITDEHFGGASRFVNVRDGSTRDTTGRIRAYHEGTGFAALTVSDRAAGDDEFSKRRRMRVDRLDVSTNQSKTLVTVEQATAAHPKRDAIDPARMNFMNTKWSPDGKTLSIVFTDQIYAKAHGCARTVKCLILVEADGSNVRFLTEFGHHPMWAPDGSLILAHHGRDGGGQDLVAHPVDGAPARVMIERFVGVHTSLDRDMRRAVTDAFDFEEKGHGAVLLYDLASGERKVLHAGPHAPHDHETGTHIHPQWSRDGTRVLFNMADSGIPQLYDVVVG